MNIETFQKFCLSLPHATENLKWGSDLCFCIGKKMFAVVTLEPERVVATFKCTPEKYAELVEYESIIPAPYTARYSWVGLESFDALSDADLIELLAESYELVLSKLPKKVRDNPE
jgi:predicted DNA-binding protein (MmcQ/YjbR family)